VTGNDADRKRAASALRGVRVAVTRPADADDAFEAALSAEGARVVRTPTARIETAGDENALRDAIARDAGHDWIVFTSATAVRRFVALGGRPGARVAAVGPATAAAAAAAGIAVHAVPDEYTADAIVPAMERVAALAGARVLWPRAEGARTVLAQSLLAAGVALTELVVYRTVEDPAGAGRLCAAADKGEVDVITFTSPSAVRAYGRACGGRAGTAVVAVIGPATAAEARRTGVPVHIQPSEHTTAAMVASLRAFYERRGVSQEGQGELR
jgi:uroporphyrinogen-III synthase